VVGFVDDNPMRQGRRLHGIAVAGTVDELPRLCRSRNVEIILIAIPSATAEQRRRVLERCRKTRLPFRTVPPLHELLRGKAQIGQLEMVSPEDLLGRQEVRLSSDDLRGQIRGRRVLVTGAAGSIGSQLSRQVAICEPNTLMLFDRAESGLYLTTLELRRLHKDLRLVPVVGDVLDRRKVEEVLDTYAP